MSKYKQDEVLEIISGMKDISDMEYLREASEMIKERRKKYLTEIKEVNLKLKVLKEDIEKVKLDELKNMANQLRKQLIARKKDLLIAFRAMGVDLKHYVSVYNKMIEFEG